MQTQSKLGYEYTGSWVFESGDDGAIFYYPHGWGRAYVVPTEANRHEIEDRLVLWQTRIRSAQRTMRRLMPAFLAAFAVGYVCVIGRLSYQIGSIALFAGALMGTFGGLIMCALIATLRFLSEAAKADLEQANRRRPYFVWLRDRAEQSDWTQLWSMESFSIFVVLIGARALWPRSETVMRPARVHTDWPVFHVWLIVIVIFCTYHSFLGAWQIRAKFRSERRAT